MEGHNRDRQEQQILRALEMITRVRPSEQSTMRAMDLVRRRLIEGQIPKRPIIIRLLRHPGLRVAVAACLVILVGVAGYLLTHKGPAAPPSGPVAREIGGPPGWTPEVSPGQIELMFRALDADGLAAILHSNLPLELRTTAAQYLAQLDRQRAIDTLLRLAASQQGQQEDSLLQLLARLQAPGPAESNIPQIGPAHVERPAVLAVKVFDVYTSRPVPDLEVVLEGPQSLVARTGPDGFAIADRVVPGQYRLHIRSDRYLDLDKEDPSSLLELSQGQRIVREIYVEPGFLVEAEVLDDQARPIQAARLIVSWLGRAQGNEMATCQTDQDGKAVIGPLRHQEVAYQIAAIADGYAPNRALVECLDCNSPQHVRIVLDKGMPVTGYARYADGRPATGLLIYALPDWWHCSIMPNPVITDANGLFYLEHLSAGNWIFKAGLRLPNGRAYASTVTQSRLAIEDVQQINLTVPGMPEFDGAYLCGTIRWAGGKRPQYIDMMAYSIPGTIIRQRLETDLDGFTLTGLMPGLYTLVFEGPNIQEKVITSVEVPGPDIQVNMESIPTPRLQGMVLDAGSGKPVSKFRVGYVKHRRWPGLIYHLADPSWHDINDPDGRFDIPTDGPGIYQVQIEANGFAPTVFDSVDVGGFGGFLVQLTKGGQIRGTVLSVEGQPLNGASVLLVPNRMVGAKEDSSIKIRAVYKVLTKEGRFVFDHLPAGLHTLVIRYPGLASAVVEGVEVMEARTTDSVVVRLTRGGSVEGVMVDRDGRPQANATLRLWDAEAWYGPGNEELGILAVLQTDEQGYYRIDALPERACWVQWQDGPAMGKRLVRPIEGKVIRLDIGAGSSVTGRLADGFGHQVPILLADDSGPYSGTFIFRTYTHPDGLFLINGVPAGTYGLYTQSPTRLGRWMKMARLMVDSSDVDLGTVPGQMASLVVKILGALDPSWTLEVREGHGLLGQVCGQIDRRVDEPGVFQVSGLLPGRYTLIASEPATGRYVAKYTVIEHLEPGYITMEAPTGSAGLSGYIISPVSTDLYLFNLDAMCWFRIDQRDGYYRIRGLPKGRYVVGNLYLQDRLPLSSFELFEGQNKVLDLDPLRWPGNGQGLLSVQVISADGQVRRDAEVWLSGKAGKMGPIFKTDTEYLFIAPAGAYQLSASCSGLKTGHRQVFVHANDLLAVVSARPVVQMVLDKLNPSNEP